MTLVIARKLGDLTWMIADTFTENPGTQQRYRPFEDALAKIKILPGYVVAFAGSVHHAQLAFQTAENSDDVLEVLRAASARNANNAQAVDFVVINLKTRDLVRIRAGGQLSVSTTYIGSQEAYERYQRHRLGPVEPEQGEVHRLHHQLDGAAAQSHEEFGVSLVAFQRTLRETGIDAGGFAVPFCVTSQSAMFTLYTAVHRAPITAEETTHQGHANNLHDDSYGGGFEINFWGGQSGFGVYFDRPQFGLLSDARDTTRLECERLINTDAFDFVRLCERRGLGGLSNRPWSAALQKAVALINVGDITYADELLAFVRMQLENHLKASNGEVAFSIGDDPFPDFVLKGNVAMTVRIAQGIEGYLAVSEMLSRQSGDIARHGRVSKGLRSWLEVLETTDMRFGFSQRRAEASPTATSDQVDKDA